MRENPISGLLMYDAVSWQKIDSYRPILRFYRAMHFSAKRGIAIACRLSVCLSVCLWRWW